MWLEHKFLNRMCEDGIRRLKNYSSMVKVNLFLYLDEKGGSPLNIRDLQ